MSRSSTPDGLGVTFGNITVRNVQQLRKMNASIFPVRYHDSFYADVPDGNPDFNQFGERQGQTEQTGTGTDKIQRDRALTLLLYARV